MRINKIRVIKSAFAMSLLGLCLMASAQTDSMDDFLGMDQEIPGVEAPAKKAEIETFPDEVEVETTPAPTSPVTAIPAPERKDSTGDMEEFLGMDDSLPELEPSDKKTDVAEAPLRNTLPLPSRSTPSWAKESSGLGSSEDLIGSQKFTKENFHQKADWQVKPQDAIVDVEPFRGQNHSIIPWKTLDAETFLDIHVWRFEREYKDKNPNWQIHLRSTRHHEMVGKVLKCKGECLNLRGTIAVKTQHLSRVLEGDEISTDKNSSAWIYLMDGSLLRVGSNTSMSFHEINFTKDQAFFLVRLNQGHVFWHPRHMTEVTADYGAETDASALPLMLKEANLEHFERQRFARQKDAEHLASIMDLDEDAIKDQYKKISELKGENNSGYKLRNKLLLVAPNATVIADHASLDFVHVAGGKSYFKKRNESSSQDLTLYLRGYTKTDSVPLDGKGWVEVDALGRNHLSLSEPPGELQVTELLTKRIRTLELAREMWVKQFTLPLFMQIPDAQKLAVLEGYHLWGDELTKRMDFLLEYTRRIETTNLKAKENLMARLEAAGEKQNTELSSAFYESSINQYLIGLKTRYSAKNLQVKEMNDLQYYVWILKNGKP